MHNVVLDTNVLRRDPQRSSAAFRRLQHTFPLRGEVEATAEFDIHIEEWAALPDEEALTMSRSDFNDDYYQAHEELRLALSAALEVFVPYNQPAHDTYLDNEQLRRAIHTPEYNVTRLDIRRLKS